MLSNESVELVAGGSAALPRAAPGASVAVDPGSQRGSAASGGQLPPGNVRMFNAAHRVAHVARERHIVSSRSGKGSEDAESDRTFDSSGRSADRHVPGTARNAHHLPVPKYVTNPIQKLWAKHLRYMAVIEHQGRTSGKNYQTPVKAFVDDGGISVVLNYGAQSDWVRNIEAADSARVIHQGKRYRLTDPRVLPLDSPELPPRVRAIGVSSRSALHGILTVTASS